MLHVILTKPRVETSGSQKLLHALIAALAERDDARVITTPHLYDLAPDGPSMDVLRGETGELIVGAWLNPRAAFWTLDANGIRGRMGRSLLLPDEELEDDTADKAGRTIWCFDLRRHSKPQPLLGEIDRILRVHGTGPIAPLAKPIADAATGNGHRELAESTRSRWYPVIDRARCTGCLECLNFCLFGVYGIDRQGRLFVENPDACKDGCPACSRVCPRGALMFPGHANPTIAGEIHPGPRQTDPDLLQLGGSPPPPNDDDNLDHLVDGVDDAEL